MHIQTGSTNKEPGSDKVFLLALISKYVANVLAKKTFDANPFWKNSKKLYKAGQVAVKSACWAPLKQAAVLHALCSPVPVPHKMLGMNVASAHHAEIPELKEWK